MQFLVVFFAGIFFYFFIKKNRFRNLSVPIILIFMLLFVDFFGGFTKGSKAIFIFSLPFIYFEYRKPSIFKKYIIIFIGGLLLSMLSCYYFRGQTIFESFWVYSSLFGILFYFFIRSFQLTVAQMEKVIFILVVLFLAAYIFQYLAYPNLIFIGKDQEYQGDIRIRLVGQGLASLGYFYSLNKLLLNKQNKILFVLILLVSLIVIFLMGFRTMILGVVVTSIILVIKVVGFNYRLIVMIILLSLSSFFVMNIPVISKKLDNMVERQKTENLSNSEYVRLLQIHYYTQEHFKNWIEYALGSGLPQRGNPEQKIKASAYGRYMDGLVAAGLNWVDWGLWSLSWVIGIIPVLVIIFYSIKAFIIKIDKSFAYLGIWFLYLVLISFTTIEIARSGNFALQAFCLVFIEQLSRIDKMKNLKSKKLLNDTAL